jgi:hypothetical protein
MGFIMVTLLLLNYFYDDDYSDYRPFI